MTKITFVRIGRFVRPHGLKGEFLVHSFTEDPLALGAYGSVYALPPDTPTLLSENDLPHPFALSHIRHGPHAASVLVSIEGFFTRTQSETFLKKPLDLFIPRARLKDSQLKKEEFFHTDLIGLEAYDAHNVHVGRVVALHNFGAGDILEIERSEAELHAPTQPSSQRKKHSLPSVMIPFRHAFVPDIDLQNHRLTVIYDDNEGSPHKKEPDTL